MPELFVQYFETPLGRMVGGSTAAGISLLTFADDEHPAKLYQVAGGAEGFRVAETPLLMQLRRELEEYFAGVRTSFTVPLDPVGSDFQRAVWEELLTIPYGHTRSYLAQARNICRPEAVRAVANANGQNRIAIVIPCHRVIGSNGKLTGFTGGLWRKQWLLEHELKHSGSSGLF